MQHRFDIAPPRVEEAAQPGIFRCLVILLPDERTALQDAASVASLLITTEAIVTEAPKEERAAATPPMDF